MHCGMKRTRARPVGDQGVGGTTQRFMHTLAHTKHPRRIGRQLAELLLEPALGVCVRVRDIRPPIVVNAHQRKISPFGQPARRAKSIAMRDREHHVEGLFINQTDIAVQPTPLPKSPIVFNVSGQPSFLQPRQHPLDQPCLRPPLATAIDNRDIKRSVCEQVTMKKNFTARRIRRQDGGYQRDSQGTVGRSQDSKSFCMSSTCSG